MKQYFVWNEVNDIVHKEGIVQMELNKVLEYFGDGLWMGDVSIDEDGEEDDGESGWFINYMDDKVCVVESGGDKYLWIVGKVQFDVKDVMRKFNDWYGLVVDKKVECEFFKREGFVEWLKT